MISRYTPPGTEIVCINDAPFAFALFPPEMLRPGLDGLKQDEKYTVVSIGECPVTRSGFQVILRELSRPNPEVGFDIARFRYTSLPSCLTELLNVAPITSDREYAEAPCDTEAAS